VRARVTDERAGVLGAEAHDLAASDRGAGAAESEGGEIVEPAGRVARLRSGAGRLGEGGAEGGRAVLEHGDVVERRHLRGVGRRLRSERIGVGARHHHAVLPVGGDRDPVAGEYIEAHRGGLAAGVERAAVDGAVGAERRVGIVEVDQFAAVGERRRALDDAGGEGLGSQLGRFGRVHVNMVRTAPW